MKNSDSLPKRDDMRVEDLGEFALIERFRKYCDSVSPSIIIGIGDDAAVWRPSEHSDLVMTCDALVEGQHFFPLDEVSSTGQKTLGARCALANLSDLSAMAAQPRVALISLGIPKSYKVEVLESFYEGIALTLKEAGASVVGGNITSVRDQLFVDIHLIGEVERGKAILRTGAVVGDRIGTTGFPGHSAIGLRVLEAFNQNDPAFIEWEGRDELVASYLRPKLRLKEAKVLAPFVHAMTDISDGLLMDLQNLLSAKQFGAILWEDALPQKQGVQGFLERLKEPAEKWLFAPSDDYELLFTVSSEDVEQAEALVLSECNTTIHWLGEVTANEGVCLKRRKGTLEALEVRGWTHF